MSLYGVHFQPAVLLEHIFLSIMVTGERLRVAIEIYGFRWNLVSTGRRNVTARKTMVLLSGKFDDCIIFDNE